MAKYYQDFVGLNTFMYDPSGYDSFRLDPIGLSGTLLSLNNGHQMDRQVRYLLNKIP